MGPGAQVPREVKGDRNFHTGGEAEGVEGEEAITQTVVTAIITVTSEYKMCRTKQLFYLAIQNCTMISYQGGGGGGGGGRGSGRGDRQKRGNRPAYHSQPHYSQQQQQEQRNNF